MRTLLDICQLVGLLLIVAALVALVAWALIVAAQLAVAGVGVLGAVEAMEWVDSTRAKGKGGRRWA